MRGYKIGEASRILGVHPNTLRKWEKEGKIKAIRIGRDRVFLEEEIMKLLGKERDNAAAIYARVSSRDQKKDLEVQLEYLKQKVPSTYDRVYEIKDIGSGLNGKRKGLLKLIELARARKIRAIYVTYPDRLTRFGYEAFKEFFKALGVEVVEVNGKKFREPQEELVEDLITIITSFAGKLYGLRSHKTKRIVEKVKEELNEC
jgi:excisionase family DNA binding protein